MPDISPADIWFDPRQILPAAKNALMYPVTHPAQTAEFALSMAPGSGEAMSAVDAWNASGRAGNALLSGNYGQAASEYGNMGAALLGAIPGAGVIARGTRRGAAWMDRNLPSGVNRLLDAAMPKDPQNTLNMGAGPIAMDVVKQRSNREDILGKAKEIHQKLEKYNNEDMLSHMSDADFARHLSEYDALRGELHQQFDALVNLGVKEDALVASPLFAPYL